jgi:hypothetical protein
VSRSLNRSRTSSRWQFSNLVPKPGVLLVLAVSIFASTGCPQLNYWDGPSKDPFFRVADPLDEPPAEFISPPPAEPNR